MLSNRLIEKSDKKIILDNNSVYWRDSFVCGVLHEQRYLIVAAAPLYPRDSTTLYYDKDKYPSLQVIKALRTKHGNKADEFYRPPTELRVDALDEYKPDTLEGLFKTLEDLQRRLDCRCCNPAWERDFSRQKYLSSTINGDRAFFRGSAESALGEGRVQVSSTVKGLLSLDKDALICFGLCISALDKINPYKYEHSSSSYNEESFINSYS